MRNQQQDRMETPSETSASRLWNYIYYQKEWTLVLVVCVWCWIPRSFERNRRNHLERTGSRLRNKQNIVYRKSKNFLIFTIFFQPQKSFEWLTANSPSPPLRNDRRVYRKCRSVEREMDHSDNNYLSHSNGNCPIFTWSNILSYYKNIHPKMAKIVYADIANHKQRDLSLSRPPEKIRTRFELVEHEQEVPVTKHFFPGELRSEFFLGSLDLVSCFLLIVKSNMMYL